MNNVEFNPFLKQVAKHYLTQTEADNYPMDELCFVLPNRRSLLFFQNYLKQLSARPILAPRMIAINDFLYKLSDLHPTDRVTLLLCLYDCYKQLNPKAESLDDFIFWGDTLLGDFSDVDKYNCDPLQIFPNISEFREIDYGMEALSESQKEALKRFLGNFQQSETKATSEVKEVFRQIWDILLPLYKNFNEKLDQLGLSYEGKVYRAARQRFDTQPAVDVLKGAFPDSKKFVFVGLTMLTECEKFILGKMKTAKVAEFCWDYPGEWIAMEDNKSSFMGSENIKQFPQAFALETVTHKPKINVLPIPSAVGQTRQIPTILAKMGISETPALEDCALVLPDENLLMPVLNAIPDSIQSVNVTMGYPMKQSEFFSFMQQILAMQLNVRRSQTKVAYYHKNVWALFTSPIFKLLLDEEKQKQVNKIKREAGYYIPQSELACLSSVVFNSVITDLSATDAQQLDDLSAYLLAVTQTVAPLFSNNPALTFESGFAKSYVLAINQLQNIHLQVLPKTFVRLLGNLTSGISIPFEGEPLNGLQVMGPLESRCLDFENLLIFSCGEGVFPRKSVSSSFIPPELRTGFGLPTYSHQDAMWAYYFYRMIARARQVWLLYDSRTEGMQRGEESRFIKQLRYHMNADITWWTEELKPAAKPAEVLEVAKTEEMIQKINDLVFSASSLGSYVACPMKFYYSKIEKLTAPAEVSEFLDGGMLGDVFHNTMRALYYNENKMYQDEDPSDRSKWPSEGAQEKLTKEYLEKWLRQEKQIKWKVDSLICRKLKVSKVTGRNIIMSNVIVNYVLNVIQADLNYLKDKDVNAFEIIALEHEYNQKIFGLTFKGYIDRIDKPVGGEKIRIVDYKSGSDEPSCLEMNNLDKIFDDNKYKAAIQFYLYDKAYCQEKGLSTENMVNSMYVPYKLTHSQVPVDYAIPSEWTDLGDRLSEVLNELKDINTPFMAKVDEKRCQYCDYKLLCGQIEKSNG